MFPISAPLNQHAPVVVVIFVIGTLDTQTGPSSCVISDASCDAGTLTPQSMFGSAFIYHLSVFQYYNVSQILDPLLAET